MWTMLRSMEPIVEVLRPLFTSPSYETHRLVMLGWLMCLGTRTLFRVFLSSSPSQLHDFSGPHGLDTCYNFFERSAWTPADLAKRLLILVFTTLPFFGSIRVIVDDTLLHKRGLHVWGLGWFRDAVASTKKRVATASGHNWVVLAIAYEIPVVGIILALPVMARLHRPGEGLPTCAELARAMLKELLQLYPDRRFVLLGDGGYSNSSLFDGVEEMLGKRFDYTGRMRADAALYDPEVPEQPKGKRGAKPKKGKRLPCPREVAEQAVPPGQQGEYQWQEVRVRAYGVERLLWACSFIALWPEVLGYRSIRVVVVHDPEGVMEDCYLMATDVQQSVADIVRDYSWRWAIEVMFKASKQILEIEGPHHYCQASVEKVAPWVWTLQTVLTVWYIVAGRHEPEAEELRQHMGEWHSEWSLAHMLRVFRRATLNAAIKGVLGDEPKLTDFLERLKNWVHLAT